jgi:hypothetical protein
VSEAEGRRWFRLVRAVTREQVAAVLRDLAGPVSARQIGDRLTRVKLCTCVGDHDSGDFRSAAFVLHDSDGFDVLGYRGMSADAVRPYLLQLVAQGVAIREKADETPLGGGRRRVFWTWVGERVDMSGLEDFPTPVEGWGVQS